MQVAKSAGMARTQKTNVRIVFAGPCGAMDLFFWESGPHKQPRLKSLVGGVLDHGPPINIQAQECSDSQTCEEAELQLAVWHGQQARCTRGGGPWCISFAIGLFTAQQNTLDCLACTD
jgi:hypothetical protein